MGSGPLWRVFLPWSVLRRVPRGLGSSQESHPLLERPQEGARGLGSSQESHPLLERPQEGACGLGSYQESHPPQVSLRGMSGSCGPRSWLQLGGFLPLPRQNLLGQKLAAQKT